MVIAPQRSIALLEIQLNSCMPFKIRVIPDEKEESVVGDVQRGELGGSLFLSDCSRELFWFLPWPPFCLGCPFAAGLLFFAVIITV